jgi:branched-chain amino acid transport system ATP-binding protein
MRPFAASTSASAMSSGSPASPAPPGVCRLAVADAHVYLGDSYIIQGVSLAVADGRTVALLGRNGAGKTTLMRAIAGLTEPPRQGRIEWQGEDVSAWPAWRRARAGLGYVPQGRRVFSSLTVEENIEVAQRRAQGDAASLPEPWTLERLYALFPVLGERRKRPAIHLSGGEQQMLAIARALAGNPRAILLDEPTEGLAPLMVEHVRGILASIRAAGLAVLLVEQDFRFAGAVADEILVMHAGRLVHAGRRPDEAQLRALAERYLGVG